MVPTDGMLQSSLSDVQFGLNPNSQSIIELVVVLSARHVSTDNVELILSMNFYLLLTVLEGLMHHKVLNSGNGSIPNKLFSCQ